MVKILQECIERGGIEPCSTKLASPGFVVANKEAGEQRLVVGYRDLNSESQHNADSAPHRWK